MKRTVVVLRGEQMDADELEGALRVSRTTEWWRALIQLIDNTRIGYLEGGVAAATAEKPIHAAASLIAHEALSELIDKLNELSTD